MYQCYLVYAQIKLIQILMANVQELVHQVKYQHRLTHVLVLAVHILVQEISVNVQAVKLIQQAAAVEHVLVLAMKSQQLIIHVPVQVVQPLVQVVLANAQLLVRFIKIPAVLLPL